MFHVSRTQSKALPFLRGIPRSLRRDVTPTQLTSPSAVRNNTTLASNNNRRIPRFKWTRRIFWGLLFGTLGYYRGKLAINAFLYPAEPGSKEDATQLERLRKLVDRLPVVQNMRKDPMYGEWDAYEDLTDTNKQRRLTSGPLKGSRALAVQVSIRRFQITIVSRSQR